MVHEIALEPELVASWSSREALAFFRSAFGLGTPRVLGGCPDLARWRDLVMQRAAQANLDQGAMHRLGALVQHLTQVSAVRAATPGARNPSWAEEVRAEHQRMPLHAIFGRQAEPPEIHSEESIWSGEAPWAVPQVRIVHRMADAYVDALAPMLRIARTITLVDPFFSPTTRLFKTTLEALLGVALRRRPAAAPKTALSLLTTSDASGRAFQDLASIVPLGARLKIVRYEARTEYEHNRYLLTELGGVALGAGFRESSPKATDDFAVLSAEVYALRRRQYVDQNEDFHFDPVTTVVGTSRLEPT